MNNQLLCFMLSVFLEMAPKNFTISLKRPLLIVLFPSIMSTQRKCYSDILKLIKGLQFYIVILPRNLSTEASIKCLLREQWKLLKISKELLMSKRVDSDSMRPWKSIFIKNCIKTKYHSLNYAQQQKTFSPTILVQMSSKMKQSLSF